MERLSCGMVSVVIVIIILVADRASAQRAEPGSRAHELLRREALQRAKEREAMLARVKLIPALPQLQPAQAQPIRRFKMIREEFVLHPAEFLLEEDEANDDPNRNREVVLAIDPGYFDLLVFGDRNTDESRWTWLKFKLAHKISQVSQNWQLSAPQKKKLTLAGQGDIKRFFCEVEAQRRDFESRRFEVNNIVNLIIRYKPLSEAFQAETFGDQSFFEKTLNAMIRSHSIVRK